MHSALLRRVITALVMAPLVLWAILAMDTRTLGLVLLLVIALAAWEWAGLAGIDNMLGRALYTIVLIGLNAGFGWAIEQGFDPMPVLWIAVPFWLWALLVVLRYPVPLPGNGSGWFVGLIGIPALLLPWLALLLLHRLPGSGPASIPGPVWVVALVLVIWGADVAAYFSGRRFGRRKLAPRVSPGKSWEGLWGALLGVGLMALVFAQWLGLDASMTIRLLALALFTVMVSVLGDLFESVLKRSRGVKDSGVLLPGHGGMLDRIDSLTAAAPVFALGILSGVVAWSGV